MADDVAESLSRDLIDTLYAGAPVPPGCRVNHARGILAEGRFESSAAARALSGAEPFAGPARRVFARFSSASADADIRQDDPHASPRGLAVKIGDQPGIVLIGHSVQAFPARDPEEFLAFLRALNGAASHPDRLDRHVRQHPAAGRFEAIRRGAPPSFVTEHYHMLHAYRFTGGGGPDAVGRLSIAGISDDPDEARGGPDYLDRDLRRRLDGGCVELILRFQAAPDSVDLGDVSIPWPDQGPAIELGRIRLERVADDQDVQQRLRFDPGELPTGIAFVGDAMVEVRVAAYRLAFERRTEADAAPQQRT